MKTVVRGKIAVGTESVEEARAVSAILSYQASIDRQDKPNATKHKLCRLEPFILI